MKQRILSSRPHSPAAHTSLTVILKVPGTSALSRSVLAAALLCVMLNAAAQSHSDLLIVLDTDGVGYTAQQTLFADDELLVLQLPPQRTTIETVFAGPGNTLYQRAHDKEPDKLTLVSGSVLTRFRHQFDSATNISDPAANSASQQVLQANLDQFKTTMVSAASLEYSVSWLLPPNIELLGYSPDESETNESSWSWRQNGALLTFNQSGGLPRALKIEYRLKDDKTDPADECLSTLGPSEWCSPDIDRDTVPDYRDLCVAIQSAAPWPESEAPRVLADKPAGSEPVNPTPSTSQADSLGCGDDRHLVLADVQFETGQTYLTVKARTLLDKVAVALKRQPESLYRIAAYTDNVGYIDNNQRLSKDRADAIRHYLILRGVSPNQVQARGYGEANPAYDNRTAAGRRANRRVELQRIN